MLTRSCLKGCGGLKVHCLIYDFCWYYMICWSLAGSIIPLLFLLLSQDDHEPAEDVDEIQEQIN